MASYVDFTNSKTIFQQFQRTGKFPIDRTSIFDSFEDAQKYALGKFATRDKRNLYASSYVGQVITVYENGDVNIYKINEDRSLSQVVDEIDCGTYYDGPQE